MLLSTLDVRPSIALCSVLNGVLERGAPDGSAAIFRHDLILLPSSCMPQWAARHSSAAGRGRRNQA
jgi:hypothetical protein